VENRIAEALASSAEPLSTAGVDDLPVQRGNGYCSRFLTATDQAASELLTRVIDTLLEIIVELLLMTFVVGALALFVTGKLLRVPMTVSRLLGLAGIILVSAVIGDVLGSAFFSHRIARRLLEETIQVSILAPAMVRMTDASVPKAVAVAVVTGLLRLIIPLTIEMLWVLFVFGSAPTTAIHDF
jgi:hypothetical protein